MKWLRSTHGVNEERLKHISPLEWEHINFNMADT